MTIEGISILVISSIFSLSIGATSLLVLLYEIRMNAKRDLYYKNELMKAVDKLNEVTEKHK